METKQTQDAPLFRLKFKDIAKGVITAVISGALTAVYGTYQTGGTIDTNVLTSAGMVGLFSGVGYLLKNLFTNSDDEFLKKEIHDSDVK